LIPAYVMRPWTTYLYRSDSAYFCYPAADESLVEGADGPPARLIKLHQALGDERRLRILRHLAAERATFQEIALALGLPKSSLHYHLSILRAAGLLRVAGEARGAIYSLRREGLRGMAEALLHYFEGGRA
jgi:DNA-binding transcriptional ArsR family regulator